MEPKEELKGSEKVWERGVALTSTLHWFETDLLAREEDLSGLARRSVSGEAGWRRETDEATQQNG